MPWYARPPLAFTILLLPLTCNIPLCLSKVARSSQAAESNHATHQQLVTLQIHIESLRDFSANNYTSVVKIIKKHDKILSVSTKDRYVQSILNLQPFHTRLGDLVLGLGSRVREMISLENIESEVSSEDGTSMSSPGPSAFSLDNIRSALPSASSDALGSTVPAASTMTNSRALNNDVAFKGKVSKLVLCVPVRYPAGPDAEPEILIVKFGSGGESGSLIKSTIDTGENPEEAGIRKLKEVAGVETTLVQKLGEFMSTSAKSTLYLAMVYQVDKELVEWKDGSNVTRTWLPLQEAIAILEDNTSIRILRRL